MRLSDLAALSTADLDHLWLTWDRGLACAARERLVHTEGHDRGAAIVLVVLVIVHVTLPGPDSVGEDNLPRCVLAVGGDLDERTDDGASVFATAWLRVAWEEEKHGRLGHFDEPEAVTPLDRGSDRLENFAGSRPLADLDQDSAFSLISFFGTVASRTVVLGYTHRSVVVVRRRAPANTIVVYHHPLTSAEEAEESMRQLWTAGETAGWRAERFTLGRASPYPFRGRVPFFLASERQ